MLLFSQILFSEELLRPSDEIDSLLAYVKPKARFVNYKPSFSVKETTFTFNHVNGPISEKWYLIYDKRKVIGFVRGTSLVDEGIRIISFDPTQVPSKLIIPHGRYHYENEIAPLLQTGVGNVPLDTPYIFKNQNDSILIFTRTHGSVTNTFKVGLDPILGYYVVAFCEIPDSLNTVDIAKATAPGTFNPWPNMSIYESTVFTPSGRPGYEGYYNCTPSIDRAKRYIRKEKGGFTVRENGFIAFLNDKSGWSACFTRSGGGNSLPISQCNAHDVVKYKTSRPTSGVVVLRMIGLPPELTSYIAKNSKFYMEKDSAVVIKIGQLETFENQPISCNTTIKGLYETQKGIKLTDSAFQGKKAMVWTGELWPDIPQLILQPNRTYQLSAFMKVIGDSTVGFITGKTYEWTPYEKKWFQEFSTDTVKTTEGWKKVSFTVKTDNWDPFIDIKFFAINGTAYLDNFSLMEVPLKKRK